MSDDSNPDIAQNRVKFHTRCHLLSTLQNPQKVDQLKRFHNIAKKERKNVESSPRNSKSYDMILDAVATLISINPKGGATAVGVRGLMADKISLVAATDQKQQDNDHPPNLGSSGRTVIIEGCSNLHGQSMAVRPLTIEKFARNFFDNLQTYHQHAGNRSLRKNVLYKTYDLVLQHAYLKTFSRYTRCASWMNNLISKGSQDLNDLDYIRRKLELIDDRKVADTFYISLETSLDLDNKVKAQAQTYFQHTGKMVLLAPQLTTENFNLYHQYFVILLTRLQRLFKEGQSKFKEKLENQETMKKVRFIFKSLYTLVYGSKIFRKYFMIISYKLFPSDDPEFMQPSSKAEEESEDSDYSDDDDTNSLIGEISSIVMSLSEKSEKENLPRIKNGAFHNLLLLVEHIVLTEFLLKSKGVKEIVNNRTLEFKMLKYSDFLTYYKKAGDTEHCPRGTMMDVKSAIGGLLQKKSLDWDDFYSSLKSTEDMKLNMLYDSENQKSLNIHAELIVMTYLNNIADSQKRVTHDYIGISKGPCCTCDLILQLLNAKAMDEDDDSLKLEGLSFRSKAKRPWKVFRARLGHGHIYPVWIPITYIEEIGDELFSKINKLTQNVVVGMASDYKLSQSFDSVSLDSKVDSDSDSDAQSICSAYNPGRLAVKPWGSEWSSKEGSIESTLLW